MKLRGRPERRPFHGGRDMDGWEWAVFLVDTAFTLALIADLWDALWRCDR